MVKNLDLVSWSNWDVGGEIRKELISEPFPEKRRDIINREYRKALGMGVYIVDYATFRSYVGSGAWHEEIGG